MHVLCVRVRQHSGRARRKNDRSTCGFRKPPHRCIVPARATAGLDRDLCRLCNHVGRLVDRCIARRREFRQLGPHWQRGKIHGDHCGLRVERQQKIERPCTIRMIDAQTAAAQCIA
jgi:hypothetical protein